MVGLGFDIPLPLQTLTEYCHDQDLWVRRIPEAQDFNDILGNMAAFDLYKLLRDDLGRVYHWTEAMTEAARATADARAWSIELAEGSAVVHDLGDGRRLKAACCWGSASEVGEAIGDEHTLVALLDLRNLDRHAVKCSLRTRSKSIPAHLVAERMGGGGHPQASGAPLDPDVLKSLSEALAGQVQGAVRDVLGGE
ncbi:MAG: hypothetical protein HYU66_08075 [Armatimonadetes bacterium]|nr:hypothetical protein [Armatimonadota bacterium]